MNEDSNGCSDLYALPDVAVAMMMAEGIVVCPRCLVAACKICLSSGNDDADGAVVCVRYLSAFMQAILSNDNGTHAKETRMIAELVLV